MNRVVKRFPDARVDLAGLAAFIQEQSGPERAIRFLREADATFQRLARMPGLGSRYSSLDPSVGEVRYFPVSRHRNFLVFYRAIPDGIEVLRVLHGRRDMPGVLADGLPSVENDPGG